VRFLPIAIALSALGTAQVVAAEDDWALQALEKPPLPAVADAPNAIDAFVRAKLSAQGIAHFPAVGRATLIRRLSYDLTGLPPTRAELDAVVSDQDPRAYEKLVARLLASPRYGEHISLS
jgi:hypothetical protein